MNRTTEYGSNFENIPVSSMEGPSSPTSIIYWQKTFNMGRRSSGTVFRKKIIVERGNVKKTASTRVKQMSRQCAYSDSHLEDDSFSKPQSLPVNNSKQHSSQFIGQGENKNMKQHSGPTRKDAVKYRMHSTSPLPARRALNAPEKYTKVNTVITLPSVELKAKLNQGAHNPGCKVNLSDYSLNIPCLSAASIESELKSDDWNNLLPKFECQAPGNKQDFATQTTDSLLLIKTVPPQINSCVLTTADTSKKGKYTFIRHKSCEKLQPPRWNINPQSPEKGLENLYTNDTSKTTLKIPDHKVIYMDKSEPMTPIFWEKLASHAGKAETHVEKKKSYVKCKVKK